MPDELYTYPLEDGRLLVAVVNPIGGDWTVYIGYGDEQHVADTGDKINQDLAIYHFPELAQKYQWRR